MKRVLAALKNFLLAIFKGELMLRMRVDKYFIHIAYTFFIFWIIIIWSILVESSLAKVEYSKKALEDLKIYNADKTVQLVELSRLRTVEELLKKQGSQVSVPTKPANRIAR